VGSFEGFLYLIGSIFAPMATIMCVDFFVLRRDRSHTPVDWRNVVLWVAGFALYRISLGWDLPCGNTLPVMAIIAAAAVATNAVASHLPRIKAME
jgi:purine-cytosine permease-like protein